MTAKKYEMHFTKCFYIRTPKLSEVQSFFENLKNTHFDCLPLEILQKIHFYNHGIETRLTIPEDEYFRLLQESIETSKTKLKKWLLKHHMNVEGLNEQKKGRFFLTGHNGLFNLLRYFYQRRRFKVVKELASFFNVDIAHFSRTGCGFYLE